jgi:hypothetical protein
MFNDHLERGTMAAASRRKKFTINDADREQWVDNDSALYALHRRSHMSMRTFVRQNRGLIDDAIRAANKPKEPYPCGYAQDRRTF